MADLVSAVTTWKVVLHGVHHAHSSYATEESQALFPAPFVQPAKIVKIVVSDPIDPSTALHWHRTPATGALIFLFLSKILIARIERNTVCAIEYRVCPAFRIPCRTIRCARANAGKYRD